MDGIETKTVGGSRNFGLAPVARAWNAPRAENNIRKWASSDGSGEKDKISWSKLKTAYGYTNPDESDNFGGYKLPFVDILGGNPKVVFRALAAIVAVLNGARGGVNIPTNDRKSVYNLMVHYYKKFEKEPPELRSYEEYLEAVEEEEYMTNEGSLGCMGSKGEDENYLDFPFEIKANSAMENGSFEGYASIFGGSPDSHGDIIAPGAFSETILHGGRNRNGIAMLWYHDVKEPIGVWESIVEDSKGLKVRGVLDLEVQRAREIHSLMKKGAIKGLSIGWDFYRNNKGDVKKDSYEILDTDGMIRTRMLKKLELWEISPVTFPSKKTAKVTKVKNVKDATTERELESVLRELGLTKTEALCVVKLRRPSLRESEDVDDGENPDDTNNKPGIDLTSILNSLKSVNFGLKIHNSFYNTK